jgi:hypothetical protein
MWLVQEILSKIIIKKKDGWVSSERAGKTDRPYENFKF